MTLDEFQTYVHALFRGDGNTPSDGTTKWNHRENLLHVAINLWDGQKILWNELWTTLTDAVDGDKTVVANTLTYDMPTNFRFLGSYVRTTSSSGQHTFYEVIHPQDAEKYKNTTTRRCFVSGNKKSGYDLTFLQQPTVGETINYPYYKEPTNPTAAADVIEMDDPFFAVYFTLANLQSQTGAGDKANTSYAIAEQKLNNMKTRNIMLPHDQTNNVKDDLFNKGHAGFGSGGSWGVSRYGAPL